MTASASSIVRALRTKLSDDRPSTDAFSIEVLGAESALMEISGGVLYVTVKNGKAAQSMRWTLGAPSYATIGQLADVVSKSDDYRVVASPTISLDHSSIDLRIPEGIVQVGRGQAGMLRHHLFSDEQLKDLVREASALHNPNYANGRVPPTEHPLVLLKAASLAYMAMAGASARLSGQSENSEAFRRLSKDLEAQYAEEVKRLTRVLPRPKADESRIGTGDVIVGGLSRLDPRTGGYTSNAHRPIGDPPVLMDVLNEYIGDTSVMLRWRQNREDNFSHFEIWRDTVPLVERSSDGATDSQRWLPSCGTAQQVFGRTSQFTYWDSGNLNGFTDSGLEPGQTYYYRLWLVTRNGDVLASNVVTVSTKAPGASFYPALPMEPVGGCSGDAVTLHGKHFHSGMLVTLGGKAVENLIVVSPTEATFEVPEFFNRPSDGTLLDVVVRSTNGITAVLRRSWRYTCQLL